MRGMKHPLGFVALASLVLVLSGTSSATVQTAQSEGAQQFADFGDFHLRNGAIIHGFRLGYRTLGKLNAEKSNAVLWPTWLGGKSEDLLDRKSTRLNSSHVEISYAVFCLKKKK